MTELRLVERDDEHDPQFEGGLEKVVVNYMPLVRHVLNRIVVGTTRSTILDYEDLLSFGTQGLIEAYHSYDSGRGVKFSTYALPRIRGAILDALRAAHPLPRSLQKASSEIERATSQLYADLQRAPSRRELAASLGITELDLQETSKALNIRVLSLEGIADVFASGAVEKLAQLADDDPKVEPEVVTQEAVTKGQVVAALSQLPQREREIVSMYYLGSQSLKSIGKRLGISESRASQIRHRAVRRLRALLEAPILDQAA